MGSQSIQSAIDFLAMDEPTGQGCFKLPPTSLGQIYGELTNWGGGGVKRAHHDEDPFLEESFFQVLEMLFKICGNHWLATSGQLQSRPHRDLDRQVFAHDTLACVGIPCWCGN